LHVTDHGKLKIINKISDFIDQREIDQKKIIADLQISGSIAGGIANRKGAL
jgi:hypothetical protein